MDYLIYTSEGFTQTEKGEDINNCQILDILYDSNLTEKECLQQYLSNHNIAETGFHPEEIKITTVINEEILQSLREIVRYLNERKLINPNEEFYICIQKLSQYLNLGINTKM